MKIKIDKIHPNIKNPRSRYDKRELEELELSLRSMGQLTPCILDEKHILLAGHRRHLAAKELGWNKFRSDDAKYSLYRDACKYIYEMEKECVRLKKEKLEIVESLTQALNGKRVRILNLLKQIKQLEEEKIAWMKESKRRER